MKQSLLVLFVCVGLSAQAKVFDLSRAGVEPGSPLDQSAAVNAAISAADEGDEFVFRRGEYFLARPIVIRGKRNLTVRGEEGVVLKLHFSPYGKFGENYGAFEVYGCHDLRIEKFVITTDNPTSCAGRVIATNPAKHTYDVLIDPEFPMTGKEHFASTDTCDEEGTPDWIIETYDYSKGDAHELIGPQKVRVHAPRDKDLSRLENGHRVLYRYSVYNRQCFYFNGCRNVLVKDVEVERCASMAAVSDHCADFRFERFNVRVPKTSKALVGANADAVHVIAMRGRLDLIDCHFERLGDDGLNVHAQAGKVKSYDPESGTLRCVRRIDGRESELEDPWAKAGDELIVYDAKSFLERGRVKLLEYAKGRGRIEPGRVGVREGDLLSNALDFPVVTVKGCTLRHTRARALVLQSREMTVSDCSFYGTSLPGVMIAPDANRWAEVGPVSKVTIRNCRFEKCGFIRHKANLGALVVKATHDSGMGDFPAGVHRNIAIMGNSFVGSPSRGICVTATDGLTVVGNAFSKCGAGLSDIRVHNCAHVEITDNKTDKPMDLLLERTER